METMVYNGKQIDDGSNMTMLGEVQYTVITMAEILKTELDGLKHRCEELEKENGLLKQRVARLWNPYM